MGRRPVIVLARDGEDVPVEAHLLAVVLADVRVVPVRAWIRHVHAVRERLAKWDRRLRLVRAVVAVFEPQSVPVHGRIDVAAVRDVDGDRRVLGHFQRRARDRAVIGKHAHGGVPDLLPDWCDLEIELVAVGELDDFRTARVRQPLGRARKLNDVGVPVRAVVVHSHPPYSARAPARTPASSCGGSGTACAFASCTAAIRWAMNCASSFTQPIRAEPRVCCQVRPRK